MQYLQSIQLRYTHGWSSVTLREMNGHDELSINGTGTRDAIRLLQRLLVTDSSGDAKLTVEKWVTADRDHVMAALYTELYGKKIDGSYKCKNCKEKYSIDFMLPDLEDHLIHEPRASVNEDGLFRAGSCRFRLPTGEDEMATIGMSTAEATEELWKRCVVEQGGESMQTVQEAMIAAAPIIQSEILTACPECGKQQPGLFDMQTYLMDRLKQEQQKLIRQVHRLAISYKWGHDEILDLPRSLRRNYVSMIEAELQLQ